MKLGTEVGLGPGHIVLDGDPVSHESDTAAPTYRLMSIVVKRSPITATAELLLNHLLLQLYHPENIYIVLVGQEVWTSRDLITVDTNDRVQTLEDFCTCTYRSENINTDHNNDNAQLLTYVLLL